MNSAITSADNAVLAQVTATYGLKSTQDQLALDVAARQTAADVDQKIATALLNRPTPPTSTAPWPCAPRPQTSRSSSLRPFFLSLQAAGFQSAADVAATLATALASFTDTAVRDARLNGHDTEILALQGTLCDGGGPVGFRAVRHRRTQCGTGCTQGMGARLGSFCFFWLFLGNSILFCHPEPLHAFLQVDTQLDLVFIIRPIPTILWNANPFKVVRFCRKSSQNKKF